MCAKYYEYMKVYVLENCTSSKLARAACL